MGTTLAKPSCVTSEAATLAGRTIWSQHYDVSIDYVGHAGSWDRIDQEGDPVQRDAAFRFRRNDRTLAIATIFRGRESLAVEREMETAAAAR